MDDARKGDVALGAAKYEEAVQHYTKALAASPTAVKYYIGRSTAYQRWAKYAEALADAEVAVALAHKRAVRELIKDAQFRRAIALYFLERYADAEYLLRVVGKLDEKEKSLPIWTMKVAAKLKDVPAGDEKRTVTVQELPNVDVPTATAPKAEPIRDGHADADVADSDASRAPTAVAVVPTPANKIKHDWYQNNDNVVFSVLAKGPKDDAAVEMQRDSLSVSFPIAGSTSEWSFTADPLFAPIDPAQSTYRVTSNKVEVTLRKATPGLKWHHLEGGAKVEATDKEKSGTSSSANKGKTMGTAPVYPTSSKSGAKNWDKVVEEDLDDKDLVEGDETSHFFKKLYADAGPEQQRAMMKSYQESGGTVLSTDWSNVGSGKVAPQPPEGCDAKEF